MKLLNCILSIPLLLGTFSFAFAQEIYKHVAKDGEIIYSSTPVSLQNTTKFNLAENPSKLGHNSYIKIRSVSTHELNLHNDNNSHYRYFTVNAYYDNKTNQKISVTIKVSMLDGRGTVIKEAYLKGSADPEVSAAASSPELNMALQEFHHSKVWKVESIQVQFNSNADKQAATQFLIDKANKKDKYDAMLKKALKN